MAGQRAGRVERLDHAVEGQVLVIVGRQVGLPDPPEQLTERRVAQGISAQHQRVHEEPDQLIQRLVGPPRHPGAERDVSACPEPGQQRRHRGVQHHEQGRPVAAGQLKQPRVQCGRHLHRHRPALVVKSSWPRPVIGQCQFLRQARQLLLPVAQLPGEHAIRVVLIAKQLLLPQRVVGVLHRQRRPPWLTARGPRRVGQRQVPRQRRHRPAVARDVVQHQHQQLLLRLRPLRRLRREQPRPQRHLPRQVEHVPLGVGHREPGPRGLQHVGTVEHPLVRLPVRLGEHRPQRLVPARHIRQRRPQRPRIQLTRQPPHQRPATAVLAAGKPEAPLSR